MDRRLFKNAQEFVAVDPDTTRAGYAWFDRGELCLAAAAHPRARPFDPLILPDLVLVESQFIAGRANPADVLALAQAAGMSSMHFKHAEFVHVAQWKGGAPKTIVREWIDATLTQLEINVLQGAIKKERAARSELYDAVGIGLYALGRLP